MRQLRNSHVKAIKRCQSLMTIALSNTSELKIREQMVSDISKLTDVYLYVQEQISQPMFTQLNDTACHLSVENH